MNLVAASRSRAAALGLLLLLLGAAGVWQGARMPSSIFPTVTFPLVRVIADAGEEPAARMMPLVTRPLEEAMRRVQDVTTVGSVTSRGTSELTAYFRWGTDMQVALQRIESETQRLVPSLPPGTKLDVQWMNTATFPILGFALTSDRRSQAELYDLAQYAIKPAFLGIAGVAQVQVQGGRQREFRVTLDPARLEGHGLAASEVVAAIQKQNQVQSAGLVEQNHELYLSLVNGRVDSPEALGRIAVPVSDGPPVTLTDLGTVSVADEVSFIRTTANGKPAVLLSILSQPSADTGAVAARIGELLTSRRDLAPPGVTWSTFYDQPRFVADSVRGTRDAILIGMLLAALVLLVFLRSLRLMLLAALAIPATVAVVLLGLSLTGQTLNLMTLAGIAAAIGLVADDAIVVVENIHRHMEEGRADPASSGLTELLPALVGSSLSTTVILLPFTLISGVVGAFFRPLALTMALALGISLVLAMVFVVLGASLIQGKPGVPQPPRAAWVSRFFAAHGLPAALVVLACLGGAWLLYRGLGNEFLPGMDEGSIILDYWTPPGTSLSDTDAMLGEVEKVVMSLPDVAGYSRRTGTQLGFFITEPNRGDYVIDLKPASERRPVDEVIDDLRTRIAAVEPAVHTDFGQLLEDEIGDLTGGEPQPVEVKVFGSDPLALARVAGNLASVVGEVKGVEDVFDGVVIAGPALRVTVDPTAAARFGLTAESLHAELDPVVMGQVVDQVQVGERLFDLRVLAPAPGPLGEVKVRTPSGALVPVRDVASVETGAPEAEIDRQDLRSYVGVVARLTGIDLGTAMAEIQRRIAHEVQLGPGMSIEYGGTYAQQQASFRQLLLVLLAGLLLVSVVVLFEFGDLRAPLVVSLAAAASLLGVFAALALTGSTLNASSWVGAILMVGIVGENSIFVIHEARLELRRGLPPKDAWASASRRRLRPVAMTVLATSFALMPLALALGAGSQLMQPLAIAVIGGFVVSGPLVLLVVPGLFRWLDPHGSLGK